MCPLFVNKKNWIKKTIRKKYLARKSLTKKRFFVLLKKTGFFYGGGEGICVKIKLFLTIKTKKNYNFCEYVYIYS